MPHKILTRLPSPNMTQAELTHMQRAPVDMVLAEAQHAAYRQALAATGIQVIALPAMSGYPDCTFVEDVLVSLPEISILTHPGVFSRQGEVEAMVSAVPQDRPVTRITKPATVDGGDVLTIGNTLFVGLSTRTNQAGIDQLASAIQPFGYRVDVVPVLGALHLKTAVTALAPDLLLMNPEWADVNGFVGWNRITVDPTEPFAGNSLSIGNSLFMQTAHHKTAARVEASGFKVTLLDISEFAKVEAGLTCLSVVVA